MVPDRSIKLGFRAHYPQLETKLTVRGTDRGDVAQKLEPVMAEVRKRLGNFILAEDDQTLEGVVLTALTAQQATLAVAETFTGGQIAARLAPLPTAETVFRRGVVARDLPELSAAVGLEPAITAITKETAAAGARALRSTTHASHALAVLVDLDEGADRIEFGGTICIAIATETGTVSRRARRVGGRARGRGVAGGRGVGGPGGNGVGLGWPPPIPSGSASLRADRLREDINRALPPRPHRVASSRLC